MVKWQSGKTWLSRVKLPTCNWHPLTVLMDAPDGFTIVHWNDAYQLAPGTTQEPIGGAARFVTKYKEIVKSNPSTPCMVTCAGDIFNPSMLSVVHKGKQMLPIVEALGKSSSQIAINCSLGTHYACVGNHDFDFGEPSLVSLIQKTAPTQWILSNLHDKNTGQPVVGCLPQVCL